MRLPGMHWWLCVWMFLQQLGRVWRARDVYGRAMAPAITTALAAATIASAPTAARCHIQR